MEQTSMQRMIQAKQRKCITEKNKTNEELNYIKDIALNDIKDKAMMRDVHFINVKRPFY